MISHLSQENVMEINVVTSHIMLISLHFDKCFLGEGIDVLSYNWPTYDELRLNQSQAEALKLALTHELAVIQGPPGTGKTHVGLEVMKILVKNKDVW